VKDPSQFKFPVHVNLVLGRQPFDGHIVINAHRLRQFLIENLLIDFFRQQFVLSGYTLHANQHTAGGQTLDGFAYFLYIADIEGISRKAEPLDDPSKGETCLTVTIWASLNS
jgi:hypothetical protein